MHTYFSAHPKTKLKFNPGIGTDVALPTPNPVTQFLPTTPTTGDVLTGTSYTAGSNIPVKLQSSTSSIMRGTPSTMSSAPAPSPVSSVPLVDAGRNKPEMSTLNSGPSLDSRSTLDARAISKGTKKFKGKPGLLGKNPSKNYYRSVLNAM